VHLDTLFDSFQADEATAVDSATTMEKIRTGVKVVATMNTAQNIVKPTEYPK
jgi:urease gamma subunit